jgi:hypothetical protein
MVRPDVSLPYVVPPSVISISGVPDDLGSVTDLHGGHSISFTVSSSVFHESPLAVDVTGPRGSSTVPTVLQIPSAAQQSSSSQTVSILVPGAEGGQHGQVQLRFHSLRRGVHVKNADFTVSYYVPTWWESNWKWVVPTVIIALILIYVTVAYLWERITKSWDTRRRAALES